LAELICDTSALIALHQVGLLHILPALSPTVMSPRIRETILKAAGETP